MEEMNQEGDATQIEESTSERRMSRFAFGIVLIIVVACIWVGASEWIQWIFGDLDFQKPYFMTFFNTTGFCFYNFGFVLKSWRRIPWKHDAESARLANAPLLYSISELWRCALMFCPLWFAANSLFNFSLAMTSVASNTILSSTSSIWTLVMSRVILGQPITIAKVVAVALVIGGSCLVATTDDGSASHSIAGDMVALLSAFFYGAYTTILKWCLPDEKKYNMGMVFGFVGVANLLLMWPGIIALDLLKVEQFEFPPLGVLGALSLNALIGTNLSDVLWAKSVILTSPLVATLGLSLTTPLAMIADFSIHGDRFSPAYVVGAALVVVGFTASSIPWDQIAVPWRDTRSTEEVHDSDGIS